MKPRSVAQKLRDTVDEARAQLEEYASRLTLEPDARHEEAFHRYARALRALVADHLYADNWSVAGDPQDTARVWRWDGYARAFHFDYTGRSQLATTAEPRECERQRPHRRLLWHRAAMELDPAEDLDAELRRLADEAKTYREAAELMEVAWSRQCALDEEMARPRSEQELHAAEAHPDFEYETIRGPRKAFDDSRSPDGEGWERNRHRGRPGEGWDRFEFHEEAYWMRRTRAEDGMTSILEDETPPAPRIRPCAGPRWPRVRDPGSPSGRPRHREEEVPRRVPIMWPARPRGQHERGSPGGVPPSTPRGRGAPHHDPIPGRPDMNRHRGRPGEGWDRFEFHEEAYWMRRRSTP